MSKYVKIELGMAQEMKKKLTLVKQASASMEKLAEIERRLELAEKILELVKAGSVNGASCVDVYADAVNGDLKDSTEYNEKEASDEVNLSFGEVMSDDDSFSPHRVGNSSTFRGTAEGIKDAELPRQYKDKVVDLDRPSGIFSMTKNGSKSLDDYYRSVRNIGQNIQ